MGLLGQKKYDLTVSLYKVFKKKREGKSEHTRNTRALNTKARAREHTAGSQPCPVQGKRSEVGHGSIFIFNYYLQ